MKFFVENSVLKFFLSVIFKWCIFENLNGDAILSRQDLEITRITFKIGQNDPWSQK